MANENRDKTRVFRKLEELNLLDDFLFQEMVSSPEVGEEFCRILLRVILGKEIRKVKITPQRSVLGGDTDRHGVRLDAYVEDTYIEDVSREETMGEGEALDVGIVRDIYDIEPNKVNEPDILPRKMRYYHGLIDTKLLETSVSYEKLPNVFIIMILPYDPFDRKRMVYTMKNQCVEDSTVSYEDGAVKIFLYTRGTEGNPSQDLIDMLKYIEVSTEKNIVNQDIKTVHDMVKRTKQKKEVGIKYMKSWELERIFTERGRAAGLAEGRLEGRTEGLAEGRAAGLAEGRTEGFAEGQFCLLCEMVQNREISLENASRKIDLLPDIFAAKMEKAGYKVPV